MNKGKLYLVGLHIGNPKDISERTIEYIKIAKNMVIEREQAFENIWPQLGIEKPDINIISIEYDSGGGEPGIPHELHNMPKILELLNSGEDVYVVADEGMPGVADPGEMITKMAIKNGIDIVATPGPSIVMAAAAVAGVMHNFIFEAFLPFEKEERISFIKERKDHMYPMIIVLRNMIRNPNNDGPMYGQEIPEFLGEAMDILGKDRQACLCYDLTTYREKTVRGTLENLKKYFDETERTDSQITIVIDSKNRRM